MKSSRRATGLPSNSSECFLFSLLGGFALTPGPSPLMSALPSTSSSGMPLSFLAGLGNFDGWEGYGRAKKYGWLRAWRYSMSACPPR